MHIPGLFRVAAGCCWLLAAAAASPGGIFEEFLRKILKKKFQRARAARGKNKNMSNHDILGGKKKCRNFLVTRFLES